MNLKAFLVDALGTALDLGLGSPDDVLRHLTPDVLANQLPRPLWARLITACLGAPKVDAQLVVDTIGVPNLVEHIATDLIWAVVADIATKALGGARTVAIPSAPSVSTGTPAPAARSPFGGTGNAARTTTPAKGIAVTGTTTGPTTPAKGVPLTPPPPAATPAPEAAPSRPTPTGVLKTSIPSPVAAAASSSQSQSLANLDLGDDEPTSSPSRARTPTGQRFRQSQSGLSRMTAASAAARRPQAQAPAPQPAPMAAAPAAGTNARSAIRRGATDISDLETETSVGEKDWDQEINVDEDQLVDWQSSEETVTGNESTLANLPRKR